MSEMGNVVFSKLYLALANRRSLMYYAVDLS